LVWVDIERRGYHSYTDFRKMRVKRILFFCALVFFLFGIVFYSFLVSQRSVPILMYHSVGLKSHLGTLNVSPASFRRQMEFIARHNYRVIPFEQLKDAILNDKPPPPNSVVITFDDGYENNYTYAFPILKKYDFPAIIFLVSNAIGKEGFLSWEEIREMLGNNISVGSHTANHVYLPQCSPEEIRNELLESKKTIEANTGREVKFLCYPIGGYTKEVIDIARELGYKGACTTNRGKGDNVYALRRIKMTDNSDNPFVLQVKLSGFYDVFRRYKEPH